MSDLATSDSSVYQHTFYGILNADGAFWTPLAFEREADARAHITRFWSGNDAMRDRCLREFQIVPVRIQLTEIAEEEA